MKPLELPSTTDKQPVFDAIALWLSDLGLEVSDTDFDRPWGGFFVIADASAKQFVDLFFPGASAENITPKILVAAPGKRLSWQYHYRRAEHWNVVSGPVGIITSDTDDQGSLLTLQPGETASFGALTRHRLVGLDGFGVVAETWEHVDPSAPSDEDDIVRVEDDFKRAG